MGQQASIQEFVSNSLAKIIFDDSSSGVCEEIISMNYEDFIARLGELNKLSSTCLDTTGKQLVFAVKRGSDNTLFWKATVHIACIKVELATKKIHTYRLLNLREFLQVFRTLQCQHIAAQQSKSKLEDRMSVSTFYENLDSITQNASEESGKAECCICLERTPNVLLPCTHSYCMECIEEWNEDHHSCPICRANLQSTDESWVLSEVPNAEEISEEMKHTLMDLAEEKPHSYKYL